MYLFVTATITTKVDSPIAKPVQFIQPQQNNSAVVAGSKEFDPLQKTVEESKVMSSFGITDGRLLQKFIRCSLSMIVLTEMSLAKRQIEFKYLKMTNYQFRN